MNIEQIGELIKSLRLEKNLTQKQLGDILCLSDKTISKWERGLGLPDISIVEELARIFEISTEKLLKGDLEPNETNGGNMKKIKFYTCPNCNNIITSTAETDISCCGRKLSPAIAKEPDKEHEITVELLEGEYYISFNHSMTKEHYLTFIAYASYDKLILIKLYPEGGQEVRMSLISGGKFYYGCNNDGLFVK